MKHEIMINGRPIGPGHPPYIIAELSANHNGSLDRALQTIDMAKKCDADAVKIQTYNADTMTIDCDSSDFQIHGGLWDGFNLYKLYQWAETPFSWHKSLFEHARERGITIFSSPFDETAVDLLEDLGAPAYKVASFEIVDLPLVKYIASTGKPVIISTGMANLEEIREAVEAIHEAGGKDLVLLHCISGYPTPVDQANLRTIPDIAERFNVISGLSDHTLGIAVSVAGVALGASVIEKHVTLSRDDKGPDSEFSLEPEELKQLCHSCRDAWLALGNADYVRQPVEMENIRFRRSIYVVKDIQKGEKFSKDNIRRIRPGFGIAPKFYEQIIGQVSARDLQRGMALNWEYIKKQK